MTVFTPTRDEPFTKMVDKMVVHGNGGSWFTVTTKEKVQPPFLAEQSKLF